IFGPQPFKKAMPLLKDGTPKPDILKETGCTVAINDASFEVNAKEIFVVMGLSGSGKSTVLRCLNRLIEPTEAEVYIDGADVMKMSAEELRMLRRRKTAMVFQNFGLLPHRTVLSNTGFGLEIQGEGEEERNKKAMDAIHLVGLDGYEHSMVQELSGGMQQRVGLARALATDPEILLMDEAFSALDPLIRTQMQDELLALQAKMHKSIVFITHDLDEALKLGDRIAIMKDGVIVQTGTPEEILTEPADDYVSSFVENVDRSKVLTAGTVMHQTSAVVYQSAGPHQCARKMHQLDLSTLFVVDPERRLLGYVIIDEVAELAERTPEEDDDKKNRNIQSIIREELVKSTPETPISELLNESANSNLPIPVLDENGVFHGIVTRAAILAAIAGD
ncbi:MAG: quaternary amine ABC transporter ATP-binding protein, partial [Verrucomicrobiota bacterium]